MYKCYFRLNSLKKKKKNLFNEPIINQIKKLKNKKFEVGLSLVVNKLAFLYC